MIKKYKGYTLGVAAAGAIALLFLAGVAVFSDVACFGLCQAGQSSKEASSTQAAGAKAPSANKCSSALEVPKASLEPLRQLSRNLNFRAITSV